jgi:hypothetical protein
MRHNITSKVFLVMMGKSKNDDFLMKQNLGNPESDSYTKIKNRYLLKDKQKNKSLK